jgi:hypothetical protein
MAYPFSRLRKDGFWERIPKPGYNAEVEYNAKSMARLREMYGREAGRCYVVKFRDYIIHCRDGCTESF